MIAPGKAILAPIVQFRFYYFAIGAGFILLIIILIRVVTGRTVAAIREVSIAAEHVTKGDYGRPLPVAHMLRLGILPQGYICPKQHRAVRDLLRRRLMFVRQRTSQILSLQSMITRNRGLNYTGSDNQRQK
jgi:hypothetical protein